MSNTWTLIESDIPLDNPTARPKVPPRAVTLASDLFSGGDVADINGRTLDAKFGGATNLTWLTNVANVLAIVGGVLTRGTATVSGRASVAVANAAVEAGYRIVQMPASDGHSVFLDVRANVDAASSSARNGYRLQLTRVGGVNVVQLQRRLGNGVAITAAYPVQAGDRIGVRAVGSTVTLVINLFEMESYTDPSPIMNGGFVYFEPGGNAMFGVDDFYIEQLL